MSREMLTEHILLNLQTFPQFTGQFYVANVFASEEQVQI